MSSSFDLFSDVENFVNPQNLGGFDSLSDLSSKASWGADKIFGISQSGLSGNFISSVVRNLLGGCGFIVDTVTGGRLIFQYNVAAKESGGADYTMHAALARSIAIPHYKGGQDRVLELPIIMTMQDFTRDDVRRSVRFLESLAYPDYNGDEASLAPHPVVIIMGKMYAQDLWLVRNYNIEWGDSRDPITQLPSEAVVNLTLFEVALRGKSHNEVLRL